MKNFTPSGSVRYIPFYQCFQADIEKFPEVMIRKIAFLFRIVHY